MLQTSPGHSQAMDSR